MNRSLKVFLRGYLWFDVNGEYFLVYQHAKDRRKLLSEYDGDIDFQGFHIFKGWLGFYSRSSSFFFIDPDEPTHCTCDEKDHGTTECPYSSDIHNLVVGCNCCPYCQQQCADEV
jgi:hypothetical protein